MSIFAIPSLEAVLEVDRHEVYLTVGDDPNLACLVLILWSSPSLVDRDAQAQTIGSLARKGLTPTATKNYRLRLHDPSAPHDQTIVLSS
jgi:hypothetical protein